MVGPTYEPYSNSQNFDNFWSKFSVLDLDFAAEVEKCRNFSFLVENNSTEILTSDFIDPNF